ncbi:TonB-dependent receptor [Sphingobacterium sp. WQ 366]|uniref:TonB-dependent receptor n=2 Tax=Sphingobacterium bovistauri TaxID=2781959 RepID=A0ABS7Z9P9_9SPHI|nr:TonB-dependent receptor [Sphingobacterium bovistauri]
MSVLCSIVSVSICIPLHHAYSSTRVSFVTSLSQQTYVGSVVNSEGQPLVGASVRNKTSNAVTFTKSDGKFSVSAKEGDELIITYTGYITVNYVITSRDNDLKITLDSDTQEVEEVIVVGYNSLKESNISGAVSRVDMKVAEKRRVQDVAQMLQGQASGINITQSTGQPGDAIDIRVRGVGTIGNNSPLFVVDGIPTTNFSFINPADIESISVLKDASSAAIYGSRAAAGVILITTKSGKVGSAKFDVNVYTGVNNAVNLPEMMNTTDYLNTLERAWANSNSSGNNPYAAQKNRTDLSNTNWLNELFEQGKTNSLQLSASGATERISYLFSGGYYDQNGIVKFNNDKYRRLELRSNVRAKLSDRVELKTNILLNHQDKMVVSSRGDVPGIIRHALLRPPVLGVYRDQNDPTYSEHNRFTDLPFYVSPTNFQSNLYEWSQNPIAQAYYSNNNQRQFKLFGNVEAGVDILKDKSLRFRSNVGVELNFNHSKVFMQNFGDDERVNPSVDIGQGRHNRPNGLNEDRGEDYTITWNNILSYDKTIGDHLLNALVGTEFINNVSNSINASRRRFEYTLDRFQYMDLGGTGQDLWNGGFANEWGLFSVFSSATYSYKNRYNITGNLRADASSRFGSDNKWGYFPSIALGWTVSNEGFFPSDGVVNFLKLRGSSGKLGNQNIPNYAYLSLFSREGNITRYGNPDLRWESTLQNNLGIDLRLMNNKLEVTADVFHKKTKDILLAVSLPTFIGNVDATYVNAGQVDNKGFEFTAKYRNRLGTDGNYSFGGNITSIDNKVVALHENVPRIIGTYSRAEIGQPLDVYYGYQMDGIYQNQNEITSHLHGVTNPSNKPGDIKFRDLNADGLINDMDRTFIGNPIPKLSYGFFAGFDYKGFDLNVFFQGVSKVDRYNDGMRIIDFDTRPFNYTTRMLDAWDGEGSSNTLPRVAFEDTGISKFSTLYIEDASFLRVKNLEVGYSFGQYAKRLGVNNARLYVSGQNLFTWTKYKGLDPETTDLIDKGTYPQSKSILVGLNFNF